MSGWGWNSILGWVKQRGAVLPSPANKIGSYGVKIVKANGNGNNKWDISGYSWSTLYGWICWGATCDSSNPDMAGINMGSTPGPGGKWTASMTGDPSQGDVALDPNSYAGIVSLPNSKGIISLNGTCQNGACTYGLKYVQSKNEFQGWAWHDTSTYPQLGWVVFSGTTIFGSCTNGAFAGCTASPASQSYQNVTNYSYDASQAAGRWYTSIIDVWLQTRGNDVYSRAGLTSGSKPPFVNGSYNATYLIQTASASASGNLISACPLVGPNGKQEVSCGSPTQTPKTGFTDLSNPASANSYSNSLGYINNTALTTVGSPNKYGYNVLDISQLSANRTNGLNNTIYYSNGDLTINDNNVPYFYNASSASGAGTIVVKGTLRISKSLIYDSSPVTDIKKLASVAWVVLKKNDGTGGNVTFDDCIPVPSGGNLYNAAEVSGTFYAEGAISTGTGSGCGGDNLPLWVHGTMLAKTFNLQRTYVGNDIGSEMIDDDGRLVANTPPGLEDFSRALPVWRNVAPQ